MLLSGSEFVSVRPSGVGFPRDRLIASYEYVIHTQPNCYIIVFILIFSWFSSDQYPRGLG